MALHLTARHEARGHRYEVMVFVQPGDAEPLAFIAKNGSADAYPFRPRKLRAPPYPTPEELLAMAIAEIDADSSLY